MSRSSGSRSARLLLVEDSPADARYLREVFKEAKIRNHLHHVTDAEAALAHLATDTPDLVLLDMHLPGMQGDELIRTIRAEARLSSLPIVVLAPSEIHAERLRSEGLDAHCCLLKPISVHALLQWVARIDSLGVALMAEGEAA
jgi:CheY-like chemotaxis protein